MRVGGTGSKAHIPMAGSLTVLQGYTQPVSMVERRHRRPLILLLTLAPQIGPHSTPRCHCPSGTMVSRSGRKNWRRSVNARKSASAAPNETCPTTPPQPTKMQAPIPPIPPIRPRLSRSASRPPSGRLREGHRVIFGEWLPTQPPGAPSRRPSWLGPVTGALHERL